MPFLNTVAFLSIVMLSLTTSNNSYASRGIFQTPIFTQDECTRLIKAALQTASRNAASLTDVEKRQAQNKGILEGWHSSRHNKYPTTDLSVIDDAFTMEDRLLVEEKLNDRLVPIVERLYGVVPKALHCSDLFIVRYDANDSSLGQTSLDAHTDSSDISFNILLGSAPSDNAINFEGGGTRFYNRAKAKQVYIDIQPPIGNAIIHTGAILHEGLPITSGTRYILVGFLQFQRTNQISGQYTGLSPFASLLSVDWLSLRSLRVVSFGAEKFTIVGNLLRYWNDVYAPHFHVRLVEQGRMASSKEYREEFLKILDGAAQKAREQLERLKAFKSKQSKKKVDDEDDSVSIWFGKNDPRKVKKMEEEEKKRGNTVNYANSEF
mmetsp:Transcript_45815/g.69109  ORF Transcript_45815/g.69109 Transcript_45815/m.69109 type:complete len:378 (+) Transcript_45815:527-1660(+)